MEEKRLFRYSTDIKGECFTCGEKNDHFVSIVWDDRGMWTCPKCASIIEKFLEKGGLILSLPFGRCGK